MKLVGFMPTYRRAPFKTLKMNPLFLSIYSWFLQKNNGPLVIVHDGKIEDWTKKVVTYFKNEGKEIVFEHTEKRRGPSSARNRCLEIIKTNFATRYIFSWEDDCLFIKKNSLNRMLKLIRNANFLLLIPAIHIRKIKWFSWSFNWWDSILGSKITNFRTKINGITECKNACEVFLAKKKFLKFGFPELPWKNDWGAGSLIALTLAKNRYKIGYTDKVTIIHLRFGSKLKLSGNTPKFDYKLPISYREVLRLSNMEFEKTGTRVPKSKFLIYKLAGIASIYSVKHSKVLDYRKFKELLKRVSNSENLASSFYTGKTIVTRVMIKKAWKYYKKFLMKNSHFVH